MNDIMDLHTHTTASGHAYSTLSEMIRAAADRKLTLYGCSDHGPKMAGTTHPSYFINFRVIPRVRFGVHVLMGAELNIMDTDGRVDLPPSTLAKLDYTIASLHIPCFTPGTPEENTKAYLNAMKNPKVTIIGHPDDDRYPLEYDRLIPAALENRVALEVSNSSFNPRSGRQNARKNVAAWLAIAREYRLPIILGSDAHVYYDVGELSEAIKMTEQAGYPEELILNAREDGLDYILNCR